MKDRLIFALDVPDHAKAKELAAKLRGRVGMFKIGLELFTSLGPRIVQDIQQAGVPVFLDLKLHDIPKTVERAARIISGLGVRFTTVHASGGREMLQAAVEGVSGKVGILAVTVLTSTGQDEARAMGIDSISDLVLQRARMAKEAGCAGVVCSGQEVKRVKESCGAGLLAVCPGVRPAGGEKGDQKRVVTPSMALSDGADYIVVGRPIRDAVDPAEAARRIVAEMESAG